MPTVPGTKPSTPKKMVKKALIQSHLFDSEYTKLNQEQKKAVDTIEGPVMVVAGPGTGKTQVVAMRVANILRKTQMRPGNILCLTFSVNGATAMRERLRALIGPDAYGVTVKNFHSFCNDLIQEYPIVFQDFSALQQISDVERYRELNKIIDQLLPDLQLVSRKHPYMRTRDILSRMSELKREGVTDPEKLKEIVKEFTAQMSTASKPSTKQHEKNLVAAIKFGEFVEVFLRYQQMLRDTQRYDYDDMILYVIDALREHDWLLQGLQERYQYILVDEFQDTNGAQYTLIKELTTYAALSHEPNLFVVGDDDQAIYRFQGANLKNILSFHDRFGSAPIIVLTTSYRSTQPILDAANALIAQNTERLVGAIPGLTKDLTSVQKGEYPLPKLVLSPSDMTEPFLIADVIDERLKAKVPPKEIAVLVQKNSELLPLYDVLVARGIPVQMSGKVNLLTAPLVRELLTILRAAYQPEESVLLGAALGCMCFTCTPADIARVFALRRTEEKGLLAVLMDLDIERTTASNLPLQNRDALLSARNIILDLHHKLPSRTIVDTLEHAMKDTGLLDLARGTYAAKDFDPMRFASLQEFFERVKSRAYEQPNFSLQMFLSDLEYYENPEYGDIRMTYDLPHLLEEGVHLMTAHKSKGLEFHTVILANFRYGHWDKKHSFGGIAVPEDLLYGWEKEQKSFEKTQDERRLSYVAMTRAKRELLFTCPKQLTSGDAVRDVSPSAFFAEAGELPEEFRELKKPEEAATLLFDPVIISDKAFKAFLKERLEHFYLSVTALNHFLDDPQKFLMIDLLQTPQAKDASFVYGNAVHDALKQWGLSQQLKKAFSQDDFMNAFRTYLEKHEILTKAERERMAKDGEEDLPRYFAERLAASKPHVFKVELPLTVHLEDIPLKGQIDRIDIEAPGSSRATVIDYKTGRPQTENEIRNGDYFRQLAFYALLLENQKGFPLEPASFVLDFIGQGTDHPIERKFEVTGKDKKELTELISSVWQKILALDFTRL